MTDRRPLVVLVGPPGSGKTSVGRALAARLGVDLHDTDAAVEDSAGESVADIFVVHGEARFRALEAAEVTAALTRERGLLALGGGAVMTPAVRDALAGHRVVFLDVGIADAAIRIGFDRSRPLLAVNPRATWVALMAARRQVYEQVATWRVDTAGRSVEDVATQVEALLTGAGAAEGSPS